MKIPEEANRSATPGIIEKKRTKLSIVIKISIDVWPVQSSSNIWVLQKGFRNGKRDHSAFSLFLPLSTKSNCGIPGLQSGKLGKYV